MKIRVNCRTNLDDYRTQVWPDYVLCTPEVGHYVKSGSGKVLKICRIIHCWNRSHDEPYIELELTKEMI